MSHVAKAESGRRLLTQWEPPENSGNPVGVLATTYTLDTALFEEECLARFAGVQSDPLRDGALYRIEREEKLAGLVCAAVIADVHHCAGRRSLRWDLLAARPASGIMHAKVSLLVWQNQARVLIGSANLTEPGYRRNQECMAALQLDRESADWTLLDPLMAYLRELLALTEGPGRERATRLLGWVDRNFGRAGPSARGLHRALVLLGPNSPSFFEQLKSILPGGPPCVAHVVSPFFDPDARTNGPAPMLWGLMRQRGEAEVHYHVAGEEAAEVGRWRLEIPRHVLEATPSGRSGVHAEVHPIRVAAVPTERTTEMRPLHAKSLTLTGEHWSFVVVGSSNFTSAGMGLSKQARNYEANVAYLLRGEPRDRGRRELEASTVCGGRAIDADAPHDFDPALGTDGESGDGPPPLPLFFGQALLQGSDEESHVIRLTFRGSPPPGHWVVRSEQRLLVDTPRWYDGGHESTIELKLPVEGPPPSVLRVDWADGTHQADWPVNVVGPEVLPVPAELKNLSLGALLELLSSARPLDEALRAWLRRQPNDDDTDVEVSIELVDPHAKVDTRGFLIKRVQRACRAISELRNRLAQPVLSTAAMAWRIRGPVGAHAVLDAIASQCDPDLPDEHSFLLSELLADLRTLKPNVLGGPETQQDAKRMLVELQDEIGRRLDDSLARGSILMRDHVTATLEGEVR